MKFSETWLREWVNPAISTQELADTLTMAGLENDGLHPVAGKFNDVIIGKIQQAEPHPKADRLRVCQVDVGAPTLLNIVCGAPNAREGIKVAVAMIGASLPNGINIQRAKLRDVVSEGMLCSAQELGLPEPSEGIIELPEDAPLGQSLRQYFNLDDTVIELGITPNRGDCLSVIGIAREVAALTQCTMNEPVLTPIIEKISDTQKVVIECSEGCGQYVGRIIKNINPHAKAPRWLTERVNRAGTRAIFPVVDITNYLLNELGQPLHAFDLDTIKGTICVRLSRDNESITLLDGNTITLKAGALLITDDEGPIALAGIMGGLRTAVTEKTQNIFLESAWFAPKIIAGKARQYGLFTDAAHRYERGVDPTLQQKALTRAINLIQSICGGDVGPEVRSSSLALAEHSVSLQLSSVERLLGITLTKEDRDNLASSFNRLGLHVTTKENTWEVAIPYYRSDLSIEADLIEEAARVYGYDRIPSMPLEAVLKAHAIPENKITTDTFSETLVTRGYHEIISYSFVNKEKQERIYPEGETLGLLNPISSEYTVMRKGLWVGLLETAAYNQNRQISDLRIFEQSARFIREGNKVEQKSLLAGLCFGTRAALDWSEPTRSYDFYDIKGDVESLLSIAYKQSDYCFESIVHPALHPGQSAKIISHGKTVGYVGALHPELTQQWDLTTAPFLFELDLALISETSIPEFKSLSKFPSIRRDLSFLVDKSISAQALMDCIKQQDQVFLQEVQIFDQYEGTNIPETQKSLAIALTLQHPERTLIDSEVNDLMEKVITQLQNTFSINLRAS
jgi:phenylalanyl-tRNA synthetase beta chain